MSKIGRPAKDPVDRLLERINKDSGIFGEDGLYKTECWIYTGL